GDRLVEPIAQPRGPAIGELGDDVIEELTEGLGDEPRGTVEVPPLDLFDLDAEPGRGVTAGLDVDPRPDVETELPPPFGRLGAAGDPIGDRAVDRGAELAVDLASHQELAAARLDRDQLERVDQPAILARLLEADRGQLLDDPRDEVPV